MTKKQKKAALRIFFALALFTILFVSEKCGVFTELAGNIGIAGKTIGILLWVALYLFIGYDVLLKALRNIGNGQVFDENFLMTIATIGAFCIGEYPEAAGVMLFYQIGEWFQGYAVGKSRASIRELMEIAPEYAHKEVDGELETVDPDELQAGDVFVVKPGEKVPLDGTVLNGASFLNTASLTGESVPRRVEPGDTVFSGSVNTEGVLRIRTDKVYEDSTVSKILELVENASEKKAPTEQFITKFAKVYTPVVTIAAVLLAAIPPCILGIGQWSVWAGWLRRACTFLVISCPCALVISIPLSYFGGIGAASKNGVLVKGSNFLETLSQVRTMAFDKTGTLTRGEFTVTEIRAEEGCTEERILTLAAALEKNSNHPIGRAILAEKVRRGLPDFSKETTDFSELSGRGLIGKTEGVTVLAGNETLLRENGIEPPEDPSAKTRVYVAEQGILLGTIYIEDRLKDGTEEGLNALKKEGVTKTVLLTGDHGSIAREIAEKAGIDETRAELLPGDKVTALEKLMEDGTKVCFVGDGMNDAPVLIRSDVGIAMGAIGSDAAIEAADVVLMDDDIRKVGFTLKIAKKTRRIVRENIVFALGVKLLVLILGALGLASMWLATFADVGVAVLAILNAMRTMKIPKNGGKVHTCEKEINIV